MSIIINSNIHIKFVVFLKKRQKPIKIGRTKNFTHFEFIFQSFEEVLFAFPRFLFFLLRVKLLRLSGADDEVELGHRDDPRVTVRPVERDL